MVLVDELDECMGRDDEVGAVDRGRFYQLILLDEERYAKGTHQRTRQFL